MKKLEKKERKERNENCLSTAWLIVMVVLICVMCSAFIGNELNIIKPDNCGIIAGGSLVGLVVVGLAPLYKLL